MSWYDEFIPPEIRAGQKLYEGDYSGALAAELGHGGEYFKKSREGQDEVRQGYADAISGLKDLANRQRQFQMEGLNRAENYYLPAQDMMRAIYGTPDQLRK